MRFELRELEYHSIPTLRYAHVGREKLLLWDAIDVSSFEAEQKKLHKILGDVLSKKYLLEVYELLKPEGTRLVTKLVDTCLTRWFSQVWNTFSSPKKGVDGFQIPPRVLSTDWFPYIQDNLKVFMRAAARILAKLWCRFAHGDLVNGFLFKLNSWGKITGVKIYNAKKRAGGDNVQKLFFEDIAVYWRILVVLASGMHPDTLVDEELLMKIKPESLPPWVPDDFRQYIKRLEAICMSGKSKPNLVLEDRFFWVPLDDYIFMRKLSQAVFVDMSKSKRRWIMEHMGELKPEEVDSLKMHCPVQRFTFFIKEDYYKDHGYIVKFWLNAFKHSLENELKIYWQAKDYATQVNASIFGQPEEAAAGGKRKTSWWDDTRAAKRVRLIDDDAIGGERRKSWGDDERVESGIVDPVFGARDFEAFAKTEPYKGLKRYALHQRIEKEFEKAMGFKLAEYAAKGVFKAAFDAKASEAVWKEFMKDIEFREGHPGYDELKELQRQT